MDVAVEIAITALLQVGALVWYLSGMKQNVKNLDAWVKTIDDRGSATALLAAELKGRLQAGRDCPWPPKIGA